MMATSTEVTLQSVPPPHSHPAEQFNQFSKFNEDFLHKRMEESTFSYMS